MQQRYYQLRAGEAVVEVLALTRRSWDLDKIAVRPSLDLQSLDLVVWPRS
jgi:hypothetical protein